MNSVVIALAVIFIFLLAYRFYGGLIEKRVLGIDPSRPTPAHQFKDGIDYVPTRKEILFGHHFASIAGLGPIVGPAIAVVWGWVPALLWVVLGGIFFGAVHDFATNFLSLRHQGMSIGGLTEKIISRRARVLFLLIIFFVVSLAMGVFAHWVGHLFAKPLNQGGQPDAVIPVFSLIFIAIIIGVLVNRAKKVGLFPATIIGLLLMFGSLWLGYKHPILGIKFEYWIYILLFYTYFASVLPVWVLLQPRDYINSYLLFIGLFLIYLGLLVFHPRITAPALQVNIPDAPRLIPFIFIVVACGAISGFHNLVSSGTTARQIETEKDAKFISFGGMLTESTLSVGVILACTSALLVKSSWAQEYSTWANASKLALPHFIQGTAIILSHLGIPESLGRTLFALVVVSFAMTTLDTGTRLLRYNIEELGKSFGSKVVAEFLGNRFVASIFAVGAIGFFALLKVRGEPVGSVLWKLFGSTNQMLAGLGLLIATLYLLFHKRPIVYTLIPMIGVMIFTSWALIIQLTGFYKNKNWALVIIGIIILIMVIWLFIEALIALRNWLIARNSEKTASS